MLHNGIAQQTSSHAKYEKTGGTLVLNFFQD